MAFGINDFKSNLIGGGARPSLFNVSLNFPSSVSSATVTDENAITPTSEFLIKGASLPGSTVGTYDVFFHGKPLKIAGDRSFETWETTVINDEGFEIRHKIEQWMELIQNHTINTRSSELGTTGAEKLEGTNADYKKDISVSQFSKQGTLLRKYEFIGAFPTTLGAIALDWSTQELEEFTCTWAYDSWKVSSDSKNRSKIGA